MWRAWIILAAVLTGCTDFPEVDAALSRGDPQAEFPALLPFEDILSADDPRLSETDDEALIARAADLQGRADALRRPVIDGQTRDRMEDGVTLP
jgi:hypothetical protein